MAGDAHTSGRCTRHAPIEHAYSTAADMHSCVLPQGRSCSALPERQHCHCVSSHSCGVWLGRCLGM